MAGGVSWSGATFDDVLQKLEFIATALPDVAEDAMEKAGEMGEGMVRSSVEAARESHSGELLASIGSETTRSHDEIITKFGYINDTAATGDGPREGYAYPNEYGFHHYKDGSWVEGVFALRDAAIDMEQLAPDVLGLELRRLFTWRG